MTDLARFTELRSKQLVAFPLYQARLVVGHRIWLHAGDFVDVAETHSEILSRLRWT